MPSLVLRIKQALADPAWLAYRLRARIDPPGLWRRYESLARAAGLKERYFLLSLDCDTLEDIEVVWEVHSRLLDLGIKPAYAVPGELLQKGEKVYRRILSAGGEFLNHGYREHTYFDTARGAYASCFFYDRLPPDRVREDIRRGDACLRETLGIVPQGFRAPHFGTFQGPGQLRFLHGVLSELGYRFSSSTLPRYAFRYGPVFQKFGVREIPLSGMGAAPLRILDSWNCFRAPDRTMSPEDYRREGEAMARIIQKLQTGLLNYYVDPSHIHDQDLFYQAVAGWRRVARPVSFSEFLEEVS